MRVTLIHNPGAGTGSHDGAKLQRLIRAAGHDLFCQSAKDERWACALERPADLVAVAGGDGTIARLAKRMIGRDIPIAALPLGTANNIARSLGVADAPIERLIAGWEDARRVPFDIATARGPWGEDHFLEAVGAGLFAWTMPEADKSWTLANLGKAEAKVAYALHMLHDRLKRCPPMKLAISLDGEDLSGDYVMLEAMNIRCIGPNLHLAPEADPGDGLLDVVLVTESDRGRLIEYVSSRQEGSGRAPDLRVRRGRNLRMEWTGFELHIDDRIWPEKDKTPDEAPGPVHVSTGTDRVEFLCPAGKRG